MNTAFMFGSLVSVWSFHTPDVPPPTPSLPEDPPDKPDPDKPDPDVPPEKPDEPPPDIYFPPAPPQRMPIHEPPQTGDAPIQAHFPGRNDRAGLVPPAAAIVWH